MWKSIFHQDQHTRAIRKLFTRKEHMVYYIAYEILQDEAEAEYVVQQVLRFISQNIDSIPDTEPELNTCLAKLAKEKAFSRKARLQNPEAPDWESETIDLSVSASNSTIAQAVHQYMTQLDKRSREVIYQRYIFRLNCDEIAQKMDLPAETAHRILSGFENTLNSCIQ